jgi:F-type H+-transporting ATPase subunit alpha
VEEQIAIIFCGVKGLLQKVPTNRIKNFETEYIQTMHDEHQDVLDTLRSGKIDDSIMQTLEAACKEVCKKYEK